MVDLFVVCVPGDVSADDVDALKQQISARLDELGISSVQPVVLSGALNAQVVRLETGQGGGA